MREYLERTTFFRALLIVAFTLFYQNIHAASFDCTKATTEIEKIICFDEDLSSLDEDLDRVYKEARRIHSDKNSIRAEQLDWLRNVRNKCTSGSCLVKAYEDRIDQLKGRDSDKSVENDNFVEKHSEQHAGFRVDPGRGDIFAPFLLACSMQGFPVFERDMVAIRTKTKGVLRFFEYEFPNGCGLGDSEDEDIQGAGTIVSMDRSYAWGFVYSPGNRKKLMDFIASW